MLIMMFAVSLRRTSRVYLEKGTRKKKKIVQPNEEFIHLMYHREFKKTITST